MSSSGQRWGDRRANPRSMFIVKRRSAIFWTTQVRGLKIQGTRRVKRMSPWQSARYAQSLDEAESFLADSRKRDGTSEWAIFYAGKRVDGKRCKGSHKDAPHGDAASCPDCNRILNIRADQTFPGHLP